MCHVCYPGTKNPDLRAFRKVDSWQTQIVINSRELLQSCPTLCNPGDCSPPDSFVYGILQRRILEWVAIPFSRGSSRPRDRTHISFVSCIGRQDLHHQRHLGKDMYYREKKEESNSGGERLERREHSLPTHSHTHTHRHTYKFREHRKKYDD